VRTRLPRIRRWEYVQCVLAAAREGGDESDLATRLSERKVEFERQKSVAMGRGALRKKGLSRAGELVRDSVLLAGVLGLIRDEEPLRLTEVGERLLTLETTSAEFVRLVLPRLVAEYGPIVALLDTLEAISGKELTVPEIREIKAFEARARVQGLGIGQTDFMIARDLLGQLGVVNWFLYDEASGRFCRVYLASDFLHAAPTDEKSEPAIELEKMGRRVWVRRHTISLNEFLEVLWDKYVDLTQGVPLRPVFYSHLRDAVCYEKRLGDQVFDTQMTELLDRQEVGGFMVFGSGGTLPRSTHSSSVLKSLPLKFSDGRYIVYIKMETESR